MEAATKVYQASTSNLPSQCLHILVKIRYLIQSVSNLIHVHWLADERRWRLGEGVNLYTGCVSTPVSAATALDEGRDWHMLKTQSNGYELYKSHSSSEEYIELWKMQRWRLGEGVNLYTGCVSTPVSAATALDEGRELAHED
ncbi:hypothetical protein Tco_0906072 [Tanacetum coccineum]